MTVTQKNTASLKSLALRSLGMALCLAGRTSTKADTAKAIDSMIKDGLLPSLKRTEVLRSLKPLVWYRRQLDFLKWWQVECMEAGDALRAAREEVRQCESCPRLRTAEAKCWRNLENAKWAVKYYKLKAERALQEFERFLSNHPN